MVDATHWDWDTGEKQIPFAEWKSQFRWVEEPQASPDGEKIAAIVNIDEGEFNVCVNGQTWENTYDKIWHLRFCPDGQLTALVSEMGEWTVAVDGAAWENKFGYVWNPLYTNDGVAVAAQQDMRYSMVLNGEPWEETFDYVWNMTCSPDRSPTPIRAKSTSFKKARSVQHSKEKPGTTILSMSGTWPSARTAATWRPRSA